MLRNAKRFIYVNVIANCKKRFKQTFTEQNGHLQTSKNTMTEKLIHKNITEKILQSFFAVNKTVPQGLPADIYGNALAIEFAYNNLTTNRNYAIELKYRNEKIGNLHIDFLVDNKVLVNIVSCDSINKSIIEDTKLLLRTSGCEVCMVLNSSGDNDYKRVIFSNEYKKKL